jgi:hypothetical protein
MSCSFQYCIAYIHIFVHLLIKTSDSLEITSPTWNMFGIFSSLVSYCVNMFVTDCTFLLGLVQAILLMHICHRLLDTCKHFHILLSCLRVTYIHAPNSIIESSRWLNGEAKGGKHCASMFLQENGGHDAECLVLWTRLEPRAFRERGTAKYHIVPECNDNCCLSNYITPSTYSNNIISNL